MLEMMQEDVVTVEPTQESELQRELNINIRDDDVELYEADSALVVDSPELPAGVAVEVVPTTEGLVPEVTQINQDELSPLSPAERTSEEPEETSASTSVVMD